MGVAAVSGLPDHINGLLDPSAFSHHVEQVELIQTHISYVLLAGEFVYKLKKPLDLGFLNFTTLRRRHYYCRQEVTLNRRLCDDVYLGVMPVTKDADGYRLGGSGATVDYAVQMRRLPAERMMDRLLEDGRLEPEHVDRLAAKIAAFHAGSATGPEIDRFGSLGTIRRNWLENFDQARPYVGRSLTEFQFALLQATITASMTRKRNLFARRIRDGRIRDCHGDLRASAVCFTDDICVYDCIEFNRRFRYSDVASEVAFLAMDLDRRGRTDLADEFVTAYQRATGDDDLLEVTGFYKCYRAFVRGKVNSFQLDEPEIPDADRAAALATARDAFELACRYAADDRPPLLLVMAGLSGTGKSALANRLAGTYGAERISSDSVRKALAGVAPAERRAAGYERGIYSARCSQRTYAAMLDRAAELLATGQPVILDATFQRRRDRERAFAVARQAGALAFCIETTASPDIVRQRLAARTNDPTAVSDAGWETYLDQVERFEAITELSDWQHLRLDAGRDLEAVVDSAIAELETRLRPAASG